LDIPEERDPEQRAARNNPAEGDEDRDRRGGRGAERRQRATAGTLNREGRQPQDDGQRMCPWEQAASRQRTEDKPDQEWQRGKPPRRRVVQSGRLSQGIQKNPPMRRRQRQCQAGSGRNADETAEQKDRRR